MTTAKIFPKGEKATEYFTGDAWVEMLTTDTMDRLLPAHRGEYHHVARY